MTENEPDDAAKPHHEVEGGQDDADGVHRRLELAAAPPQDQLHPGCRDLTLGPVKLMLNDSSNRHDGCDYSSLVASIII